MKLVPKVRTREFYETLTGKKPFADWLSRLKDLRAKAKIIQRIDRAAMGNFGSYRELQAGVYELKESFGPGYRVYFGIDGDEIIVLLVGGDKGSQDRDIAKAKEYWTDYIRRKKR